MLRKEKSPGSDQGAQGQRRPALAAVQRDYLSRRDLLALVPLSMSTIDTLEKAGQFPSRFVLTPTNKVCWKRHEVIRFLEQRAAKRVHASGAIATWS